jgi:hypothetical protein
LGRKYGPVFSLSFLDVYGNFTLIFFLMLPIKYLRRGISSTIS